MIARRLAACLLASVCVLACPGSSRGAEPKSMAEAAAAFVAGLDPAQRKLASLAFTDASRSRWNFLPGTRTGLALKRMGPAQRKAAFVLIRHGLSEAGHAKLRGVLTLEGVLQAALSPIRRRLSPEWRDPGLYHLAVFGKPANDKPWGWRLEGHHLSLNFTCVPDRPCVATPFFFGANPAEVRSGPHKGLRVLAAEEDLARRLLTSLQPEQRKRAVRAGRGPTNIFRGTRKTVTGLEPIGLPASAMTEPQRTLLWQLVETYMRSYQPAIADAELQEARKAGIGNIHFRWRGPMSAGRFHAYLLHGPTLFIEYSNDDNHIHSVWRDPVDEFGEASLRALRSARRDGR